MLTHVCFNDFSVLRPIVCGLSLHFIGSYESLKRFFILPNNDGGGHVSDKKRDGVMTPPPSYCSASEGSTTLLN